MRTGFQRSCSIPTVVWGFRPGAAEGTVGLRLRPSALRDVGWTWILVTARWAAERPRYVGDPHLRLVREAGAYRRVPVWKIWCDSRQSASAYEWAAWLVSVLTSVCTGLFKGLAVKPFAQET